jgi:hypothetical protein
MGASISAGEMGHNFYMIDCLLDQHFTCTLSLVDCKNTRENRVSSFIKVEKIVHSYKRPSITSDRLPNPRTTVRTSLFL